MARLIFCFSVFLQGCASHAVRCDAHLQAINAPLQKNADAGKAKAAETAAPARTASP